MQTFKRFILYVLSILLVVILVSAAIIVPWMHTPTDFHDQALREKLAGTIDTLIIGQSYAMDGIVPAVLDETLGTHTYNLSGSLMPLAGQKYMLEKEIARNPVRHVLLEITPDTLTTDERTTYGNGDSYIVARLDSMAERLDYLTRCVSPEDWMSIYARMLLLGLRSTAYGLLGRTQMIDESLLGFNPQKTRDVSLPAEWAREQYQIMSIFGAPLDENIRAYEEIIRLCQSAGCEVTIIYTPVSHAKAWQIYDQETFRRFALELAARHDVPLLDFNLLRNRYTLLSDETSFSDDNHLSEEGAYIFTEVMADVLARQRAGEDIAPLFYNNYFEVVQNSVYMGM